MKINNDVLQGSPEWFQARAGLVTASEIDALVSPTGKIRESDGVETYLAQKLAEKWLGGPLPAAGSFAMEQGSILEERAVPYYEIMHPGEKIERVGFVTTDDGKVGCSPDGVFADSPNGIEIKCPRIDTHLKYLLAGALPKDYVLQVQSSMWVTGAKEWTFMSYCDRTPALSLILKVKKDPKIHDQISQALDMFLPRLDAAYKHLIELNGGKEPVRAAPKAPIPSHLEGSMHSTGKAISEIPEIGDDEGSI